MNKLEVSFGVEEMKKLDIIQIRLGLPSKELTVRKVLESFSISPNTR